MTLIPFPQENQVTLTKKNKTPLLIWESLQYPIEPCHHPQSCRRLPFSCARNLVSSDFYALLCKYVHVEINRYMHRCVCIYIYRCTYIYIYSYTCAYIHVFIMLHIMTHTQAPRDTCFLNCSVPSSSTQPPGWRFPSARRAAEGGQKQGIAVFGRLSQLLATGPWKFPWQMKADICTYIYIYT